MELLIEINTDEEKMNSFLDKLTKEIEDPELYAVYKEPLTPENKYNGKMIMRDYENGEVDFYTIPWKDPCLRGRVSDLDIDPEDLIPPERTFSVRPEYIPGMLRDEKPRRLIIDGFDVYDNSRSHICEPYRLAGFEVEVDRLRLRAFASKREGKAGVLKGKNKEAREFFLDAAKELV